MSLFWQIFLPIMIVNFVLMIIGRTLYYKKCDELGSILVLLFPTQLVILIHLFFMDLFWKWSWF